MTSTATRAAPYSRLLAALVAGGLALAPAYAGDREDIEARIAAFEEAANAGDAAALAALYTDDAILMPPGAPMVTGSENIAAVWQSMLDMGLSGLDLTPVEITVTGDSAAETGTFSFTAGDATGTGKYIVLWAKGEDGTWRLHRDIWNADTPPQ